LAFQILKVRRERKRGGFARTRVLADPRGFLGKSRSTGNILPYQAITDEERVPGGVSLSALST